MSDQRRYPLNQEIVDSLRDPDGDVQYLCDNCGAPLRHEHVETRAEATGEIETMGCPNCGNTNEVADEV